MGLYVVKVCTIDEDNNVSIASIDNTPGVGGDASVVSIGKIHYQPAVNDRGLLIVGGGGMRSFVPFRVPTQQEAYFNAENLKPGDVGIHGANGGLIVTHGGDTILKSSQSTVNVLSDKVSINSPSFNFHSGGLSISGGSDGNYTAFNISAGNILGKRYFVQEGGDSIRPTDPVEQDSITDNIDEDIYYDLLNNYYKNDLFSQSVCGKPILKNYIGSPSDPEGANSTFFSENIHRVDGSFKKTEEFSVGSPGDVESANLKSMKIRNEISGHVGFGEVKKSITKSIHGISNTISKNNMFADDREDCRSLGATSDIEGTFEKSSVEDIGDVKTIIGSQTEKLHYLIGGKVLMLSGSETWEDLYKKYDVDEGKYSCGKYLISDNGISINTSVEIWFGVIKDVPRELSTGVDNYRVITKAIIKWNTSGVPNESKKSKLTFLSRKDDDTDLKKGNTLSSSNKSGYLKIEWGEGKNDNYLYKASGVSQRNTINNDGVPENVIRQIVCPEESFSLHGHGRIDVVKLEGFEENFSKKIRPDQKPDKNGGIDEFNKWKEIVKYSHYISQVKTSGMSVETLRISDHIGTVDMFQEEGHAPVEKGFGENLMYDWDNWKYRGKELQNAEGIEPGVYGVFKETKVGTVSMHHLGKLLHNMRETISTIGKYFTNLILPEDLDDRHYYNKPGGNITTKYSYNARVGKGITAEKSVRVASLGIPAKYPASIIEPVINPKLRGGLSRRFITETYYSPGQTSILVKQNDVRVATGVDERSAMGAATVLAIAMSKMYGNRGKYFSDWPNDNFYPDDIPDTDDFVQSESDYSPKSVLLDKIALGAQLGPVDGVIDPRYQLFTSIGKEADRIVTESLGLMDDPMEDFEKFDKAITDCFPGMDKNKSVEIMPNVEHMVGVMELLRFNKINKRVLVKILDDVDELAVPDYSGLEDLFNELFNEE